MFKVIKKLSNPSENVLLGQTCTSDKKLAKPFIAFSLTDLTDLTDLDKSEIHLVFGRITLLISLNLIYTKYLFT